MKQVAKLVIIDNDDMYLILQRSGHPAFGNDPDIPGGTVEDSESIVEAMVREVHEEAGLAIDKTEIKEVYSGIRYSNDTQDSLYVVRLDKRPEITLSWEHSSYEWLARGEFLEKAKHANDTYMHMVYDILK